MPQLGMLGMLAGPLIGGVGDLLGLGATAAAAAAPAAAGLGDAFGGAATSLLGTVGGMAVPIAASDLGATLASLGSVVPDLSSVVSPAFDTSAATSVLGTAGGMATPIAASDLSSALAALNNVVPAALNPVQSTGAATSVIGTSGGAPVPVPAADLSGVLSTLSGITPSVQGALPSSAASTLASIPTTGLDLGMPNVPPGAAGSAPLGAGPAAAPPPATNQAASQVPPPKPPPTGGPTSAPGVLGDISEFLNKNKGLMQLLTEGAGLIGAAAMRPSIPGVGQSLSGLNPQSAMGQQAAVGAAAGGLVQPQVSAAQNLTSQSQPLIAAPVTGQLPPGMQTLINQALQDTQTQIQSQYAARGMSGSSAEQQDLRAAAERAASATAQLLLQTGQTGAGYQSTANQTVSRALSAAGLQDQVFQQIAGVQLNEDTALQQALAELAAASANASGLGSQQPAATS